MRIKNKRTQKDDIYSYILVVYNFIFLIASLYWLFNQNSVMTGTTFIDDIVPDITSWGLVLNLILLAYYQRKYRPIGIRNKLSLIMIVFTLLIFFYLMLIIFSIN